MRTYEKFLIKNHLLLIEEIPICTNKSEGIASLKTKLYVKTPNNQNNEDIAHCASQDRTIFVVNKWKKQKHFKVAGQKNLLYKKILHKVRCKCENLIYLLQWCICQLQYVGKNQILFNICLSNYRKDTKSQALSLTCKQFNEQTIIFNNMLNSL